MRGSKKFPGLFRTVAVTAWASAAVVFATAAGVMLGAGATFDAGFFGIFAAGAVCLAAGTTFAGAGDTSEER